VAAIRHVTTGTYLHQIEAYEAAEIAPELEPLRDRLKAMKAAYVKAVETVTATKDNEYIDFQARRMVEMAGHVIMGHLLLNDATRNESFRQSAEVYINFGEAEVAKHAAFIERFINATFHIIRGGIPDKWNTSFLYRKFSMIPLLP